MIRVYSSRENREDSEKGRVSTGAKTRMGIPLGIASHSVWLEQSVWAGAGDGSTDERMTNFVFKTKGFAMFPKIHRKPKPKILRREWYG